MTRSPMPPACVQAPSNARPLRIAPLTSVAAAVAVALGMASGDADALSLGRISVLSALGEPLRAEVSVSEITAAEAGSLSVGIASSEAFRTAGIAYNTGLGDVRAALQRRPDGRYVVQLTSTRGFSDPFVDMLLEVNTGSSRIVRDYTLLLDPPSSRNASVAASASMPAQVLQPAVASRTAEGRPVGRVAAPRSSEAGADPLSRTPAASATATQQVTVRRGDTASKIADAHRSAEISLDQMLVAMLRANPDAFVNGNLNRIRAGALIDLPDAAQAAALTVPEAKRRVVVQSRDFGHYRRRLADNAPASGVAEADRQVTGKLQASVEDRSAAGGPPDKLTIAQGRSGQGEPALARQTQESNARMAELSKNIGDLTRLQAAGTVNTPVNSAVDPGGAVSASVSETGPGAPSAAGIAGGGTPTAPAVEVASSVTVPAPVTTPVAPVAPASATTPVPEESAWYVDLFNNPFFLGVVSLLVLALGWLAYRLAGRRRQEAGESVFLESRLPKDSFFAGSGGESVDTKNRGNSIVSSLSYSPGQFDSGDVDPVAEADVYLAYGRDLQAEEILREALRVNPERVAIHLKLLEIHAKRRDLRAYESLAMEARRLTGGTGTDWSRVTEMGNGLDPGNPLYGAGARVAALAAEPAASTASGSGSYASTISASPATAPVAGVATSPRQPNNTPSTARPYAAAPPAFVPSVMPVDFDLDLDRPDAQAALDSEWVTASLPARPAAAPVPSPKPETAPAYERQPQTARNEPHVLPPPSIAVLPPIDLENDFNTEPGALGMPAGREADPVTVRGDLKGDSGFIEFDMSAFTGLRTADSADTEAGGLDGWDGGNRGGENPDAIKLSLARELHALGDTEGARSLMEEVAVESTGELQVQARQLLAKLG
ncbi:MAG: FimV/HubP family polar landmark protein [Janthinobacterium lividum]